ncbi:MAG: acyl-CoA thioesterase [Stellaceae bacterium]
MSETAERKAPPAYEPAIRAMPMPADANQNGDIFGGWVLSQMDIAGGQVAARRARGRVATVAITAMSFHQPVLIGDEVSFYGEVTKIGRSSIAVKIESWVRRGLSDERIKVTEGLFTYVAIGSDRRPRLVPQNP